MIWYNENDDFAADWLEKLIAAQLIPAGKVDRRSIVDVEPWELKRYTHCHFFAGIGGWAWALRLAAWPDHRPVWTGSCPCQPFSTAGKQLGFADDRHLWPYWRYLIAVCRPRCVLGEQVASASDWLRLVRGDMEALDYAFAARPVEAASAGADHLRDRYWFVADADFARSQGRIVLPERAGEWAAGPDGLADADGQRQPQRSKRDSAAPAGIEAPRGHDFGRSGFSTTFDLGNPGFARAGRHGGGGAGTQAESSAERQSAGHISDTSVASGSARHLADAYQPFGRLGDEQPAGQQPQHECDSRAYDWVVGADGKARRVKPGIRLLAHGVPNRVGLLRGFGNAIDPRPAAAFIRSVM